MKAFIFDFDGVMVDSETHWGDSLVRWVREFLPSFDPAQRERFVGVGVDESYNLLVSHFGATVSKEDFLASHDRYAHEIYDVLAQPIPGIRELIEQLIERRIPLAIASSGFRRDIESALRRLDLLAYFPIIACGDDVPGRLKPHPDVYLLAAKLLEYDPSECIVLEDSDTGMAAAKAAGMHVLGLRTTHNAGQSLSVAQQIVTHPSQIDIDSLFS